MEFNEIEIWYHKIPKLNYDILIKFNEVLIYEYGWIEKVFFTNMEILLIYEDINFINNCIMIKLVGKWPELLNHKARKQTYGENIENDKKYLGRPF